MSADCFQYLYETSNGNLLREQTNCISGRLLSVPGRKATMTNAKVEWCDMAARDHMENAST